MWSGKSLAPPPKPSAEVFLACLGLPRSLQVSWLRLSYRSGPAGGARHWKLLPHQQGSRDRKTWGVGVGSRGQEVGQGIRQLQPKQSPGRPTVQKQQPWRLRACFLHERLMLLATPLVARGSAPPDVSVHVLLPQSRAQLSPRMSNSLCGRQSTHQGLPLARQVWAPDEDKARAALLRVPPGQGLQAHKEPGSGRHSTHAPEPACWPEAAAAGN